MRFCACSIFVVGVLLMVSLGAKAENDQSPYSLKFTHAVETLIGDLQKGPRGDPKLTSEVPFHDWYTHATKTKFGSWGPPRRSYPEPADWPKWTSSFKRERVLATAARLIGHGYQHHHVPDWSPPQGWPWKETAVGHNGPGVDCSNLTAFAYDQAAGIILDGEVHKQAEMREARQGNSRLPAIRIALPASLEERVKILRTADLIYIKNKSGAVSHVVFWVGTIGSRKDGQPTHLVLDSHGEGEKDDNGVPIPVGIRLRPYRVGEWYHKSASHAVRYISE